VLRERIDQRRLSDVGSPDERDVRNAVVRDPAGIDGARDESGV
jgi:hypothetical protein